ncbi:alpha/beta hydrolase [Saccharopolyspora taberi]|uniref:AB hydrolase-1 domain-containing protein n=1 Tax=Saccharopolyspora taberi TaxID=60895 RepID=A0ABN3VEJ9_9PSEU
MSTFVLVPGFWLGAWAWEHVTGELRAAGHDVRPVTLTGLAERADEATPEVDVETHVADIIAVLETDDLRDVVLVGHSGGSLPVACAADRVPERLRRVVHVDSGPLPAGMAQIDFHEPEERESVRERVRAEGDGWKLPPPAFDPAVDPVEGMTGEQLERIRARATPQPFGTATQPLRRPESPAPVPQSVITCTFPPEVVRQLSESGHPVFALMAGLDLHHLPTGHWPMFSRPRDLAALLAEIA